MGGISAGQVRALPPIPAPGARPREAPVPCGRQECPEAFGDPERFMRVASKFFPPGVELNACVATTTSAPGAGVSMRAQGPLSLTVAGAPSCSIKVRPSGGAIAKRPKGGPRARPGPSNK